MFYTSLWSVILWSLDPQLKHLQKYLPATQREERLREKKVRRSFRLCLLFSCIVKYKLLRRFRRMLSCMAQSVQSARLSVPLSELDPPVPLTRQRMLFSSLWVQGGRHTYLRGRGWRDSEFRHSGILCNVYMFKTSRENFSWLTQGVPWYKVKWKSMSANVCW